MYDGKHATLLIHSEMLNIYLCLNLEEGVVEMNTSTVFHRNKFCTVYIKSMCFIEYVQKLSVKCRNNVISGTGGIYLSYNLGTNWVYLLIRMLLMNILHPFLKGQFYVSENRSN